MISLELSLPPVIILLIAVILSSCSPRSSNFVFHDTYSTNIVPPPAPDYSLESNWAALPHRTDAADTTPVSLTDNQAAAAADVFFIHPTTFINRSNPNHRWNAAVDDSLINAQTDQTTIRYQASIFNGSCKVYAPRYRQAHISVFFTNDTATYYTPLSIAYSDVKRAFEHFLVHYNKGRPFFIAAHSQGTVLAKWLIDHIIEEDSSLFSNFVAAYIPGYAVVPDSFDVIKPCLSDSSIQCYCTWSTFAKGFYPAWYTDGLHKTQAVNPLLWTIEPTYASHRLNKGAVLKDFSRIIPGFVDAQVHQGLLWINKPRIPLARFTRIKNYHIGDFNLFYLNVRENVAHRLSHFNK